MRFNNLAEAETFKSSHADYLAELEQQALATPRVAWTEVWLNGNYPSYVTGYDEDEEEVRAARIYINL